jgi:hypothetical protein
LFGHWLIFFFIAFRFDAFVNFCSLFWHSFALFGCKKKVEGKKVGGMIVEGMKLGGMWVESEMII